MADIFKNITTQEWQDMEASEENPCVGTKHKSLVDRLCERKATWVGSGDAPDPLCQEAKARILADAEVIKAAENHLVARLKALQTYFDLSDEELASMTRDERADTIRQHRMITETIEAFNRAKQGRKENNDD